jgi:hypothetical protein
VIGRQKTYRYLASQQAIAASAMETPNRANRRTYASIAMDACNRFGTRRCVVYQARSGARRQGHFC